MARAINSILIYELTNSILLVYYYVHMLCSYAISTKTTSGTELNCDVLVCHGPYALHYISVLLVYYLYTIALVY